MDMRDLMPNDPGTSQADTRLQGVNGYIISVLSQVSTRLGELLSVRDGKEHS